MGRLFGSLALVAAAWLTSSCCGTPSPGRPCAGSLVGEGATVGVVSPALDCVSHLCLVTQHGDHPVGVCTVECSSDHDCAMMDGLYCRGGYACAVVGRLPVSVCVCVEALEGEGVP